MKTTWQHRNGNLYTTQHDTFGHITAVSDPVDWTLPDDATNYSDDPTQIEWAEQQIRHHVMHKLQRVVA